LSQNHKEHPSGAKAQRLFSATCGTLRLRSGQAIEAVPFQNFGHLVVFPQPVKPNIEFMGFIGTTEVMPQEETASFRPYRTERDWGEYGPRISSGAIITFSPREKRDSGFHRSVVGIAGGGQ